MSSNTPEGPTPIVTKLAGIVSGLAAGVVVVLLIVLLWRAWATAELVESCVTPGGECAQRSVQQQEDTISRLSDFQRRVATVAAVCAAENRGTQDARQIAACIERGIERTRR